MSSNDDKYNMSSSVDKYYMSTFIERAGQLHKIDDGISMVLT